MSLINDALKRANEAAPPPTLPGQPMQATDAPVPKLPLILIPLVLLAVLGLSIWFLLKGVEVARRAYHSGAPTAVAAREPLEPSHSQPLPKAQETEQISAKPDPAPSAESSPTPPKPAPPKPTDPLTQLRLQAVFYRPEDPAAVINSKLVGIGSKIGETTVLSISRDTVVVEWGGHIRELTVP